MIAVEANSSIGFVKGKVTHVLFRNDDNDYTVATVKVDKSNEELESNKTTIIGHLPELELNETYSFFLDK